MTVYRSECGCICSQDIEDHESRKALLWAERKLEHEVFCEELTEGQREAAADQLPRVRDELAIDEPEAELKPGTIVDYAITFSGRKCIPYVEAISEQGFDGATQYTGVTEYHALSEAFENLTYMAPIAPWLFPKLEREIEQAPRNYHTNGVVCTIYFTRH